MEIVCNKMQLKEFAHRQVRVTFQCLALKKTRSYWTKFEEQMYKFLLRQETKRASPEACNEYIKALYEIPQHTPTTPNPHGSCSRKSTFFTP